MAEELNRGEIEEKIRFAAYKDPEFRRSLLDDPKGTLAKVTNQALPDSLEVKVIEETENEIYLTVPPKALEAGAELSDADLQKVAGGFLDDYTCKFGNGFSIGTRVDVSLV